MSRTESYRSVKGVADGTRSTSNLEEMSVESPPFLINQNVLDPLVVPSAVPVDGAPPREPLARTVDVALAIAILILVLPLLAVCALAVALSGPGPLLYRHSRIGRKGKLFPCLKFRTMAVHADAAIGEILGGCPQAHTEWLELRKLRCDPRVTPTGRFLRRYSLDELPQLFNVLAGHMSIVGPRPIVAEEVCRFGPNFVDYCSVKPGLTGLWQISGRHSLSYEQRVQLDTEYARSKSLKLDLRILLMTLPIVLLGQNA